MGNPSVTSRLLILRLLKNLVQYSKKFVSIVLMDNDASRYSAICRWNRSRFAFEKYGFRPSHNYDISEFEVNIADFKQFYLEDKSDSFQFLFNDSFVYATLTLEKLVTEFELHHESKLDLEAYQLILHFLFPLTSGKSKKFQRELLAPIRMKY